MPTSSKIIIKTQVHKKKKTTRSENVSRNAEVLNYIWEAIMQDLELSEVHIETLSLSLSRSLSFSLFHSCPSMSMNSTSVDLTRHITKIFLRCCWWWCIANPAVVASAQLTVADFLFLSFLSIAASQLFTQHLYCAHILCNLERI